MGGAGDSESVDDGDGTDPLLAAVGARVREAREAAGLIAADGARAAGMTKGYLWRVENGRQNLSIRSLSRVARAFSTTMSALLANIEADPGTLGARAYSWRAGADPRDPDRPLGRRRERASKNADPKD